MLVQMDLRLSQRPLVQILSPWSLCNLRWSIHSKNSVCINACHHGVLAHHHHHWAAEQATTRFLQPLRSWAPSQRRNIVWLRHPIRISQEVLNIFQVHCAWPSWLTLPMRWNIHCFTVSSSWRRSTWPRNFRHTRALTLTPVVGKGAKFQGVFNSSV